MYWLIEILDVSLDNKELDGEYLSRLLVKFFS